MVRPQTAKRRQRVQSHSQQGGREPSAQEEVGGMHDEADIMSFRSAATQRFLLNQELIENITDKWVHINSIIKPKPFASVQTAETDIKEIKDDLYFGNVELMRQKLTSLESQIESIKTEAATDDVFSDNTFLLQEIHRLSHAFEGRETVDFAQVERDFTGRFNKALTTEHFKAKSIPKLNNDTRAAPPSYWEDLLRMREAAKQRANPPPQNFPNMIPSQGFTMPADAIPGQDPMSGFKQPVFGNDDLNMMDDAFGQYSNMDDQDFLSQLDHSMEP